MYHLKMIPLTPSKKIQPLVSIKRCSPVLQNNVLQDRGDMCSKSKTC